MDKNELLKRITTDDVIRLMVNYFKIPMCQEDFNDTESIRFLTLCHNDDPSEASYKLYYYIKTKSFYCFSNCGSMSIFDLVMQMKNITFEESLEFLEQFFNISTVPKGFGKPKFEFEIEPYSPKEIDLNEKLPTYDEYILNTFLNYKAVEWLNEGITEKTMEDYEIKFSLNTNGIIIPHRDVEGRLVGIRERNLDKRQVEILKRKYVPFTDFRTKIVYKHPLGKNLYGININKEEIQRVKKAILWESEKSTLKMHSIYGVNPSVSVGGSSVSNYQLNLLKKNGCEDIYLAFDKETEKGEKWKKKIDKICEKIINFGFNCYLIEDDRGLLKEQDSPIDEGKEVFEVLLRNAKEYK